MSFDPLLYLPLFARILTFFLISPLFSHKAVPAAVRLGFAFVCTLILAPLGHPEVQSKGMLVASVVTEGVYGYLLGFFFALIFEAAALAGQMVGTLCGFSATEIIDPISSSAHPILGRAFSLVLFALFLALDLHHTMLKILFLSTPSTFSLHTVIDLSSQLFSYAISFAFIPLLLLLLLILLFALAARMLPDFQVFWTGFPLQILIGFGAIMVAISYFTEILSSFFSKIQHLLFSA